MQVIANSRPFKRIIAITMLVMLSLSIFGNSAFAAEPKAINDDKQMQELRDGAKEENIIIENISNIFISIINVVKVGSLSNTVFGNPYAFMGSQEDDTLRDDRIFYEKEWNNVIEPIMGIFMGTYFIIMVLAIMTETLRYNMNVISNRDKSSFWETVHIYAFSAIFVGSFPILLNVLFGLNTGIVDALEAFTKANGAQVADCYMCGGKDSLKGSFLGFVVLFFVEFGVGLFVSILYIARKLIILMLIILIPIVAMSLLFPRTRAFFGTWLKELAGNIFLPSIHAIILTAFSLMANLDTSGFGIKLAMLLLFVPVSGMVQSWLNLGDGASKMGKSLTMMGAAGLGGAMMLTGMMRNMKGQFGGGNSGGNFAGNNGTGATTPSNDHSDANMTGIGARATGALSPKWQGFKNAVSTAGSVAGGLIGAPMGLSPVGAVVGGKIAGGGVQLARQGVLGAAGGLKNGFNALSMPFRNPSAWNDLETRREAFGNMGESFGSMFGRAGATHGRAVGNFLSGARQSDILAQRGQALGVSQDLGSLQKEHAGKGLNYVQTNQGSWFELAGDKPVGQNQRIGAMGAADPNLRSGQIRSVPFRFRGNDEIVKPGVGGSATIEKMAMGPHPAGSKQHQQMVEGGIATNPGERIIGSGSFDLIRTGDASISSNGGTSSTMDTNYNAGNIQTENYFAHGSGDHQRLNTPQAEKVSNSGYAVIPGAVNKGVGAVGNVVYKGVGKGAQMANDLGRQTYIKASSAGASMTNLGKSWVNGMKQSNRRGG